MNSMPVELDSLRSCRMDLIAAAQMPNQISAIMPKGDQKFFEEQSHAQ